MTEIVALEDFSLTAQGPTLSFSIAPGQAVAVVGPAASGKTRMVRCLTGENRAGQGAVHVLGKPAVATRNGFSKRSTPQSILRHALAGSKTSHAAESITACGLWDLRQTPVTELSTTQVVACELIPCLGLEARLLIIDGQLDRLDPWTLSTVLEQLRKRLTAGDAVVAVTNRADLLSQFDSVLVADRSKIVFAGPVAELLKRASPTEVEIRSDVQPGVLAMVAPFTIGVSQEEDRTVLHAEDGQELAARLLLEGYGEVRYVVFRQATPEEALMNLTKTQKRTLKG